VRRRRAEWWGTAILAALAIAPVAGCAGGAKPDTLPAGEAISVDVADLWKKESAEDPIKAYTVRLAADPDNAGLHNNLGNAYVLKNMMDKAIHEFKTAAKLDPESAIPWNNMGTTYRKMEKHSQAHSAFRKALDIDPRYALAWYNLGTLYDDAGDYDAAIQHYLKAVALKPQLAEVKFNPQVVENRNLMVVKLRHFLEESGNIALPLDRLPE
jgi:tetratricopeptide (TPR) repeat protein